MNIRRILFLSLIFAALFAVACASIDNAQRKKEAEAKRDLGEAYLRDRKFTLALKELLEAEKLNPNDYYLQNDLGLVYYHKNLPEKAIVHFKKSLDIKPMSVLDGGESSTMNPDGVRFWLLRTTR